MIDSSRLVSQSNYSNNSNNDCDWLILACFIREQSTTDATFIPLEKKFSWRFSQMRGEIFPFFITKQIKNHGLYSVAKHLGSGWALKK